MSEKRLYTEEEIEFLAEQASQNAMEHFKYGVSCGECVFKGFLDLGLTDVPVEAVALASGFGGGMGSTRHTCGAVNGGMLIIGTTKGRRDPYALPTFEERVDELNHEDTGVYARHGKFVREVITEYGTIECRDLTFPFPDFHSKDRARKCKKVIGFCAREAAKAALKDEYAQEAKLAALRKLAAEKAAAKDAK